MNPPEAQSDSVNEETYFDPEASDSSEQYFSASLETVAVRPAFEVESEDSLTSTESAQLPSRRSEDGDVERRASRSSETTELNPSRAESAPEKEPAADWRHLVSAKVKHYKTLKPRQERYPSLQLQFDTDASWKRDSTRSTQADKVSFIVEPDPQRPVREPDPPVFFQPTTEATARVLEFPRPGMLPFNRDELAEPVLDRPRIVEAPELVPLPPALGGILIEPVQEPQPERQPGLDMPLSTARLSQRLLAAAVDATVVSAALAVFGYLFLKFNASLPEMRTSLVTGAALFAVLWFAYQYAFLTFCGTTLGLRAARLKVLKFDGTSASRNLRRWRIVASILSTLPLGLGYAWCFFDEDQLSWHDRITKTHLAPPS